MVYSKKDAKEEAVHYLYNLLSHCRRENERQVIKNCIALINEQLHKSPTYVQYLATQKWNGELPSVMGAGAVPFVDVNKMSTNTS
jgi:hypothetical protein